MEYPGDFINKIICGDCLEVLKEIPDNCIDSIVTDPPAGIAFLGEKFDTFKDLFAFQDFIYKVFSEAIRVLKPGGHILVWALPRTAHHTAMGIERAEFEIKDKIYFVFGSGMPKSLNIGKKKTLRILLVVRLMRMIKRFTSKKNIRVIKLSITNMKKQSKKTKTPKYQIISCKCKIDKNNKVIYIKEKYSDYKIRIEYY